MRVYLLTDLEGVAGVLDLENWCRENSRYRSVEVWRSDETHGPRVIRKAHPTSIIGLLNATGVTENLDADPLRLLPPECE